MKRINVIFTIILSVITGCGGNKQSTEDVITVDVTKNSYPKKNLILQDFMDVEYIPLETNDHFINQGLLRAVGKNMIAITNRNQDGDIFIYDRKTGKAFKKINRKGLSGEEYTGISDIVFDEDNGEVFVNSYFQQKIVVSWKILSSLTPVDQSKLLPSAN